MGPLNHADADVVRRGDDLVLNITQPAARSIGRALLCQTFVVYVALNMTVCALLFAPWALPRETVSGLLGRWETVHSGWRHWFARGASWVVDRIYFWEPNHCVEVFLFEAEARKVLYPEKPGAKP